MFSGSGCKGPAATPEPTPTPTPPTSTPAPTALISGTVYKDESGDGIYDVGVDVPIPSAIVTAYLGDEFIAKEYASGEYEYGSLTRGQSAIMTDIVDN